MKLTQLRYFKTVAELGKISLAAEALYVSPPALSVAITSLEKELGTPLFDHTSNQVTLNEQGRIFLRYVNQVFNNLDCAKLELQQSLNRSEKIVHIAVTTSNIWIPLISAFALEYPHIMLSFTTMKLSQMESIANSQLHAFILAEQNDFASAGKDSEHLFEERPVAIVPLGHPLAEKESITLSELTDEILFLPMADQSLNKRIKELFACNNLIMKYTHECADGVCKSMVADGRGISLATTHSSKYGSGAQRYIPIEAPNCRWEQRIYWSKERTLTSEELSFKDFILEVYGPAKHGVAGEAAER